MGNNNETRIVLGSLRYKSAPDVDSSLKVPLIQNTKEIIEFDRTIDIDLEQVYNDERQISSKFRPSAKFQLLFKNTVAGSTNYTPFENNLYYLNTTSAAIEQCVNGANVMWTGYPQYYEFDFIRNDYNVLGYTQPSGTTNLTHINFQPVSASSYNWNFFLSYPFSSVTGQTMFVFFKDDPNTLFTWECQNGIPFIIQNTTINGDRLISFKCPVKHGLKVGEYAQLSFSYGTQNLFQVYSLGLEEYGNEEYVFNIYNVGYTGTTFNNLTKGTFKRVIDNQNIEDTMSKYYVRKHKILTNVEDAVMVNAGFERNIFGTKKKYESSGFTPNYQSRVSIKEDSQSYTLSFNTDVVIRDLRDNQMRPLTELFFTVIWKGYFGWTCSPLTVSNSAPSQVVVGLQQGWEFNLPLNSNSYPNSWWFNIIPYSNTQIPTDYYIKTINNQQYIFYYNRSLKSGDELNGDFCEWNRFEQNERVISNLYHKFKFNPAVFPTMGYEFPGNRLGYYYQPHHPITLKVFSDYVENGDPENVVGLPDYAEYSSSINSFVWRDIYDYGYIDSTGRGVNYPFFNGTHYPFRNIIFRIIPEGSNYTETNIIFDPITDFCE